MKQSKFLLMLLGTAMTFFLISCGGGGEKKSSEATSTDTTDTAAATTAPAATPAAPVSAIITTPTNVVLVRHKVADFSKWQAAYDADDSARLASGLHNDAISRDEKDPHVVMVALRADDVARAKAFARGAALKREMQRGGVTGAPVTRFYTMVFRDTAATVSNLRAVTTFKVKDWDAWKKSFDSTRELKTDNGLTPKAYGYDADDNHNVIIEAAVLDTAKAHAYWNSDMMKQRRAASGALGTPQRFVYTVVKRY